MSRAYLEVRDGKLYFDGCDLTEVAEKFGTPLYVYSQNALAEKMRQAVRAVTKASDSGSGSSKCLLSPRDRNTCLLTATI